MASVFRYVFVGALAVLLAAAGPAPNTPLPEHAPGVMAHPVQRTPSLTKGECVGLGGTVGSGGPVSGATGICESICTLVDRYGVIHHACINETLHRSDRGLDRNSARRKITFADNIRQSDLANFIARFGTE